MPRRRPDADLFVSMRSDYTAAKRSGRLKRRRRGIPSMGAGADWHYRSESDFLWMGEASLDIYRNDCCVGQMIDRAVEHTLQGGMVVDPETGDPELDADLKARWIEEAQNPERCDPGGELTFHDQEEAALRAMFVPGDVFTVAIDGGETHELREQHRCRAPQRSKKNIVHGVEMEADTRRRLRYYFTREPIDPLHHGSIRLKDLVPVEARDERGEKQVYHCYRRRRASQTRGVTALAPVFDMVGMHDDLQFAQLLKAQMSAMVLILRNRTANFDPTQFNVPPAIGRRLTDYEQPANGSVTRIEGLSPGTQIASMTGENVEAFTPNIPNAEFFPHMNLVLTLVGINLGMPLVLALMDTQRTTFHGYRGAVDQARLGFRCNQRRLIVCFHRPYYRTKLHFWADEDPALAAARERLGEKYLSHRWQPPSWPYIEPVSDATGDLIRNANMLSSPRRIAAERGIEFSELARETREDRGSAIRAAAADAQAINQELGLAGDAALSWRDLAPLPNAERVNINVTASGDGESGERGAGSGE